MPTALASLLSELDAPAPGKADPADSYTLLVRRAVFGDLPAAGEARAVLDAAGKSPADFESDVTRTARDFTLAALTCRVEQLAAGRPELRTAAQRCELAGKVLSVDHVLAVASGDDLARHTADWPALDDENAVNDLAERITALAKSLTGSTAALDCRAVLLVAAARLEDPHGTDLAGTQAAEILRS